MSILAAHNLAKYYGAQDVFAGVHFAIARGDKIALVGPNGAGKTTLLRLLLGLEEPSAGRIQRARGLRIGYLPQQAEFPSRQTLYAEMLSVFDELRAQQRALLALAEEMARSPQDAELLERYAAAEQRFDLAGGYAYENRIRRVLSGLGFGPETYDWPIATLSGGQVTRALLAKLLLEEPELLLLDEPTNYLDLQALEWLEAYLQDWPHSLLVISHDRYFLDKVAAKIWELNHGRLETYRGNYSHYVRQRLARQEHQQREYEAQQALIAKTEDFVRRYHAGQRSKEAQGRQTRLERLERLERPPTERTMSLRLSTDLRSGDNVLLSDGVAIGYAAKPDANPAEGMAASAPHLLFETGALLLRRGDRIALLGPNGAGKTTFLRTILGELAPLRGALRIGASVRIGYLPQQQDWLAPSKTILEQVLDVSGWLPEQARTFLGRFLFSGEDVFKQIGTLSGGELARVGLAVLAIRGANFLLLDEPTTHLDIASQEVVQEVLAHFEGSILFVSHDRYLIDALATHVWAIEEGRMQVYEGNYSAYLAERERRAEQEATPAVPQARDDQRRRERQMEREARKHAERLHTLEAEIHCLERELEELEQLITLATRQQDAGRVHQLGLQYQKLEDALAERLQEWERAAELAQER